MNASNPATTGVARFLPGLALVKGINVAQVRTELVVGVTVFAVLVPSAMAYGDLAGVTPVVGLHAVAAYRSRCAASQESIASKGVA